MRPRCNWVLTPDSSQICTVVFSGTTEHGPCIYLCDSVIMLLNGSCVGLCLLVGFSVGAASATLQSVFWCLYFCFVGYYLFIHLSVFSKDLKNCILLRGMFLCWLMGCTLKKCKIYGLLEMVLCELLLFYHLTRSSCSIFKA